MGDGRGGCGCSGGGVGGCAGCGGKGALGPTVRDPSDFVRPRYFAGQLLTEDDLQASVDYLLGKRRLSNRMLFGAGVGAGLQVRCDPCDPRRVRVLPGYAIDGVGNDVYLPCPTGVDLVSIARQLEAEGGCSAGCDDGGQPGVSRKYLLWMRYAERLEEPVVPHLTDDPCTHSAPVPEATRVREGVRFALTCDDNGCGDAPPPDPRVARLAEGLGDIGKLRHAIDQLNLLVDAPNNAETSLIQALEDVLVGDGFDVEFEFAPSQVSAGRDGSAYEIDVAVFLERVEGLPEPGDRRPAWPQIKAATDALRTVLTQWYSVWLTRQSGVSLLEGELDNAVVARVADATRELVVGIGRWEEAVRAVDDQQPIADRISADAVLQRSEAIMEVADYLSAGLRDPDGVHTLPVARPDDLGDGDAWPDAEEWLSAVEAWMGSTRLGAGYPVNDPGRPPVERDFDLDLARALGALTLQNPATVRAWRSWLGERYGDFTCGRDGVVALSCSAHRMPARLLDLNIPQFRPSARLIETLYEATRLIRDALAARLHDAVCEVGLTPFPPVNAHGVLIARIELLNCTVERICTAGRPQIDSPWARRSNNAALARREWDACRGCCEPAVPGGAQGDHDPEGLLDQAEQLQRGNVADEQGASIVGAGYKRTRQARLRRLKARASVLVGLKGYLADTARRVRRARATKSPVEVAKPPVETIESPVETAKSSPATVEPLAAATKLRVVTAKSSTAGASVSTSPEQVDSRPQWNTKMRKDALLRIAERLGLSVTGRNTKAQILAALDSTSEVER